MELQKHILKAVVEIDGKQKLHCEKAHDIANASEFSLKEIGQFCQDKKIKIIACELGCF